METLELLGNVQGSSESTHGLSQNMYESPENMHGLPEEFLSRMREMLGTEYEDFLRSYSEERSYGLRRNPFKAEEAEFLSKMPFSLTKVSWAKEGYFCPKEEQPGRHVLHEAGAYYIQEPSAMAVADFMDVKPSECICDLCAAPGGKSTQLAGAMKGQGLLISNEIVTARARILSQNIERLGIRNCVVLNEDTDMLAEQFPLFFHGILVDAPCSGEGMFRKDENARAEWSAGQVTVCAERQLQILENADRMLAPGGRIIYSTCTFAPEENEGVLVRFLRKHPEYTLMELPCYEGMDHGHPEWVAGFGGVPDFGMEENEKLHLEYCRRLWPHRLRGEGHFAAGLRKAAPESGAGQPEQIKRAESHNRVSQHCSKEGLQLWEAFAKETLTQEAMREVSQGVIVQFGEHLYLVPEMMRGLKGLKIERAGLELGEIKKNRFEPSHALALTMQEKDVNRALAMTREETEKYMRGEALACNGEKGWTLMTYEGYAAGWAKVSGNMAKNHYPKGLRIQG